MRNITSISVALVLLLITSSAWAGPEAVWSELKLVDASGVPAKSKHEYHFKGVLEVVDVHGSSGFSLTEGFYSNTNVKHLNSYWVAGKGSWDASRNTAQELLQLQHDGGIDSLNATFRCNGDPWIINEPCVVINVLFNSTASVGSRDWPGLIKHYRRPLTVQVVTLSKATKLSKHHKTASAPPPPPPAKHKNTVTYKHPSHMDLRVAGKTKPNLPTTPLRHVTPMAFGLSGKPASRIGLADLTNGSSLIIGGERTEWGRTVRLNAADAITRNQNGSGECQFPIQHAVRNVGRSASGAFDGVWRNSSVRGTTARHWPSLAPGKLLDETDLLALRPGMNKLSFQIDPSGQLKETNRANNHRMLAVNLTGSCGAVATRPRITHFRSAAHLPLRPEKRLQLPSR
jgi:hypothetical protein